MLERNHAHYTYADEYFFVYLPLYPKEIELVFEGEQVSDGVFAVDLDKCMSSAEGLAGGILALHGRREEVCAESVSREEWGLAEFFSYWGTELFCERVNAAGLFS
ncbi:hypothetical protein BLX41_05360 [Pseudomonas protegens]|nr:hypothetical protein BLX41_05360 [Pseudomonas protegens]